MKALDTCGEDGNGGEKVRMNENNSGTMGLQDVVMKVDQWNKGHPCLNCI